MFAVLLIARLSPLAFSARVVSVWIISHQAKLTYCTAGWLHGMASGKGEKCSYVQALRACFSERVTDDSREAEGSFRPPHG